MIDPTVEVSQEAQTALFLGSAAFFSGAVWQPTVNVLEAANLPFNAVAGGTMVATGMYSFFLSLYIYISLWIIYV